MSLTRSFVDSIFQDPFFSAGGPGWAAGPLMRPITPQISSAGGALAVWKPSCDVRESANEYTISAAIPGAKKEDVSVELEGNVLRISGRVEEEKSEENDKQYYMERAYGEFARSFSLPQQADAANITAEHKDGVLCVHVPKIKEQKSQAKRIGVN